VIEVNKNLAKIKKQKISLSFLRDKSKRRNPNFFQRECEAISLYANKSTTHRECMTQAQREW